VASSPSAPDELPSTVRDGFGDAAPLDALDELAVCAEVERRLFGASELGVVVGRYRLIEAVGAGSFGVVYRAEDPELDRIVALKLLRHRAADDDATDMLLREARAMAKLAHPNVVHVYDAGIADGRVFVAMELVEGMTLRTWLGAAPRKPAEALEVLLRAGAGLAAAHAAGLLHRDFKPDNVLVERGATPRVRVTDFGLALAPADDASTPAERQVAGTPGYMAPEQAAGEAIDARADEFAFCVTLWEALHGERPFDASSGSAFVDSVAVGPRTQRRGVPSWLREILRKGLRPSPSDRFPSMDALLEAIARRRRRRRRLQWGAGIATFAVATGTVAYRSGAESAEDPCRVAARRIELVWDDARAAVVRDAFERTRVAFADTAAASVIESLDAWRQSWTREYTDACSQRRVQTGPTPVLDAKLGCLDDGLGAFGLMVDQLAKVDAAATERALAVVSKMNPPSDCSQAPVVDDGVAEASVDLRAQLGRVQPLRLTGRTQEAAEVARSVATDAAEVGDPSLEAEALHDLGDLLDQLGRVKDAVDPLRRGYWLAEETGDDALAVRIATILLYVHGAELAELDEAERWREHASAKLRRLDEPPRMLWPLQSNQATVAFVAGEFDRALAAAEAAIDTVRASASDDVPTDELRLASVLDNRGAILLMLGRYEEARRDHEQALEIVERRQGALHPDTASSWGNLGNVATLMGDLQAAEDHFRTALRIWEEAPVPRPLEIARCHNNIGNVLSAQKRWDEAVGEHELALAQRRELFGSEHPEVAQSLENLGSAVLGTGDAQTAVSHHEQALAIRRETLGDEHYALAYAHHGLGRALARAGRRDEAIEHLRAAVDLRHRDETARSEDLAQVLFDLARVLDDDEKARADAIEAAEQARDVLSDPQTDPERELHRDVTRWLIEHGSG
jgi:tetratricopeptide (TPR) repeat protein